MFINIIYYLFAIVFIILITNAGFYAYFMFSEKEYNWKTTGRLILIITLVSIFLIK